MGDPNRQRNIRAHQGLDRLGYAHRFMNHAALAELQDYFDSDPFSRDVTKLRLLDVGCGSGYLLQRMLKRGWDALGVDPYPRGRAIREPLRSRVVSGSLDAVSGAEFDAVTAIEVVEHIPDYPDFLKGMVELLRPGGMLMVTVPNDWDFQPVPGPEGLVEPKYGHLWRFSASELESDLTRLGGKVVVRPIYSRHLDHRLHKYSRVLTVPMSQRLSARLVARHDDGAWLLGRIVRQEGSRPRQRSGEAPPSARHYLNDPLFIDPLSKGGSG